MARHSRSPSHVVWQRGVGARSWGGQRLWGVKDVLRPGWRAICVASNAQNPCFVSFVTSTCVFGLVEGGISFERSFGEKRSAESMQH